MKNVYTSWDINLLADKMIEKITESWKTPFESPAVIFTDPKVEQWFKLHWLKNQTDGKAVLMNLKTLRIQQFLFDLVKPDSDVWVNENAPHIEKLSVELLRDVIISKLTSRTDDGKYYFESLGSDNVQSYLTDNDAHGVSQINSVRLYDFAQQTATLFMDYEDTRPDSLNLVLEKSDWQKKLYHDIYTDGAIVINDTRYMTLFQLAELNSKMNGGQLHFNWKKDLPLFIFGFSGLGQIYRKILDEFSKQNQLEVYLQTSQLLTGKTEGFKNQLTSKWAEYGKENLGLWSKGGTLTQLETDNYAAAGKPTATAPDSLLHKIQKSISQDNEIIPQAFKGYDDSLSLTSAPTKLREVETVHSKICRLLSKNPASPADSKKIQLGDILVVAPNIQDYNTAIRQVFDQSNRFELNSDFPYIPYIIADYSGERSLTAEALNVFIKIFRTGYFSRADLFSLLRNYLVQTARGISDDEVSDWVNWASELNTYRNRAANEDWEKAKKRLLLSKLTDLQVGEYIPYENLTTENNDSLYKFIQAIDELEELADLSGKNILTKTDIEKLGELLDKWLLLSDEIPDDLFNETLVFQNIVEEVDRQKETAEKVYADCFFSALLDRSHSVSLHNSNLFSTGITFANFESNRVLPARYVFFMGLDSKVFPGVDSQNDLDLKACFDREAGDESVPMKNKNAFMCQLMAAGDGFFISYINKDLQKDEDFYKSSVLTDLFETVYDKEANKPDTPLYENKIKIDETRDWDELYTQREFRNKKNYIRFQNNSQNKNPPKDLGNRTGTVFPDRVSISDIKTFLTDPFQFMVKQEFGSIEDDSEEEIAEFEPIVFDHMTQSSLRKDIVKKAIKKGSIDFDETELTEFCTKLKNQNILPDFFFGNEAIRTVFEESRNMFAALPESLDYNDIKFDDKALLTINQNHNKKMQWSLSGEIACHTDFSETKPLRFFEFNNSKNCLTAYISALAALAQRPETDNSDYNIELYVIGVKEGRTDIPPFTLNRSEAQELLKKIYNEMYIEPYTFCVPYDLIEGSVYREIQSNGTFLIKTNDKVFDFSELQNELTKEHGGKWSYFSKAKLFNTETDLGYKTQTFSVDWAKACEHQADLMKFINIVTKVGE